MKNRLRNRFQLGGLSLPLPMIDVFALVLLYTLLKSQFLIDRISLPIVDPGPVSAATIPKHSIQISLRGNGEVLYQGQPAILDEVPALIKAQADETQPILVSIETDDEGRGHTQNLFRLRRSLAEAEVSNPVEALLKLSPKQ